MIIAPLAWNLATNATVNTVAKAFERGSPASNLFTTDPRQRCVFRGEFGVAALDNDKCDYNDGSAKVATLNAGAYYGAEILIEVARAFNVSSSNWLARHGSTAGGRNRIWVARTSGTSTLQIASGANAAYNFLVKLCGFRIADRTPAAAIHQGDFSTVHYNTNTVEIDLGSAKTATASFVAGVQAGPGCCVWVRDTVTGYHHGDAYDSEVMAAFFDDTPLSAQTIRLEVSDPRTEEVDRTAVGYWYYGPTFNTDRASTYDRVNFEAYTRAGEIRYIRKPGVTGQPFISEVEPGDTVTVAFGAAPGFSSGMVPAVESLCRALKTINYAFLAFDHRPIEQGGEWNRESGLFRLKGLPTFEHLPYESKLGRWATTLTFEKVALL